MARGRRCCCCQDIYHLSWPFIIKVTGTSPKSGRFTKKPGGFTDSISRGYFDLVNKELYMISSDRKTIFKTNKDVTNRQDIYTVPGTYTIGNGIAIFPQSEYIFYGAKSSSTATDLEIRRVNFDGTNDTLLVTRPVGAIAPTAGIVSMAVSQNGFIFYDENWVSPSPHVHLRRCTFDGSGDTMLKDWSGISNTNRICVDNKNGYLFYSGGTTDIGAIGRCDFSGNNEIQIITRASNIPPFPPTATAGNFGIALAGWSHKYERLYIVLFNPAAINDDHSNDLGVWSCKFDGSDLQKEVVYPQHILLTGANYDQEQTSVDALVNAPYFIGCGYEQTGPTTKGS